MKIIFMGTPDFALNILEKTAQEHQIILVVTQPDKKSGRGNMLKPSPVKEWALSHSVPVFQPERMKDEEAVSFLKEAGKDADAGVVAAYGQILPGSVLSIPRLGCINVHASLLPKYRGAAPIQWSIINGDEVTGVTTMQMGPGLDDGDILLQKKVVIGSNETGGSLFEKLSEEGGKLLLETLSGLEQGTVTPVPQDNTKATKVGLIRKDFGHIDFTRSADEIERLIRGLDPWPSAYTVFRGKLLKIWSADVIPSLPDAGEVSPGGLIRQGDSLFAATGSGFLSLDSVQLEGKKRMGISDFLRGHDVKNGERLG